MVGPERLKGAVDAVKDVKAEGDVADEDGVEEDVEDVVDPPAWPDMESLLMPGFLPEFGSLGFPKL